jgi:hypothetical protein
VSKVKIPYYWVDRWENGYWSPKKHMRAAGFKNVSCGKDGPEAWAVARKWNDRWKAFKAGKVTTAKVWPDGSLGEAFERFKATAEWIEGKRPRTKEEWDRCWVHISPVFGDCAPKTITFEDLSAFYRGDPNDQQIPGILRLLGVREAHRVIKIWRALWQVAASMQYCDKDNDPSFGIRRVTPKGRTQRWFEGEVVRLAKGAWRAGYHGLACIVAIAWDTQFSPGDVRTLAARNIGNHQGRMVFNLIEEGRDKTETPVIGTISRRTERLIRTYLAESFGEAQLHPDTALFRNRSGAPYSSDTMGDDFRDLRVLVFGDDERRQLLDMRRSGAIEALAGEVDMGALSKKMGNTIDQNKELQSTYLPAQVAVVRMADSARLRGRRRLRGEG